MTASPPEPNTPGPHFAGLARAKDTRLERYDWNKARGRIHAFGESKSLASWAEDPRCAVSRETLRTRLALGWDPETAITRLKHQQPVLEFTYNGRTLTLRGWADQTGINYHTLYNRITTSGMTFEAALTKGPNGPHYKVPVTAFGETKPLYEWGVDPRAHVTASTIRKRIKAGWNPQLAITEEPGNRTNLGTGTPYHAFGRRMGLQDWARLSAIPAEVIQRRVTAHDLTLEAALRSLGWTPDTTTPTACVLEVSPDQLCPGDLVVAIDRSATTVTVRRTEPDPNPHPADSGPTLGRAAPASGTRTASPTPPPRRNHPQETGLTPSHQEGVDHRSPDS